MCALRIGVIGLVESVTAMGIQPQQERMIYSEPLRGQALKVDPEIMTSLMAVLRFRCGAVVNYNMIWDAWDSGMPRMELYGTEATLVMAEEDPNKGPNVFGGDTLVKTRETYRWKNMPRHEGDEDIPWEIAEVRHDFDATSFVTNNRGIGLVDMVRAIYEKRPCRASGAMALHSLEVGEAILKAAREERFVRIDTGFDLPAPMPQK